MIDGSVLQEFSTWVANNWAVSAIVGGLTWDVVKATLAVPFKSKLGKWFTNDAEAEVYLENICEKSAINKTKPYRDVEDIFEKFTGNEMPAEFIEQLKELIIDSKSIIDEMNKKAEIVFNVKEQKAGRDINNINGSQITINK
ncbi:hypothetical protein [Clostridium lundense]|uniref:hypothetical protein n=1 Tax=Clostridium lundense TaxID=319475 RepID=UPI000481192A|nr:hypothetical protein [Clostridium lundense]